MLTAALRVICAPNPSMMTQNGTNTYLLGSGDVAVIDPGPAIAAHQDRVLAALLPRERISHIFVTHAHLDHSGLAPSLARITGAPVYAFGDATAGQSRAMQDLVNRNNIVGGVGVDVAFRPDIILADADLVTGQTWEIEAIHTPGHMGNHLCFANGGTVFSGDHVMGWSTTVIAPPEGDMTDYMRSLDRLRNRRWDRFLPGHGEAIANPGQRLDELIAHRRAREAALLGALAKADFDIPTLTAKIYPDLDTRLIAAARLNILAHLIDMIERKMIRTNPDPGPDAVFAMA